MTRVEGGLGTSRRLTGGKGSDGCMFSVHGRQAPACSNRLTESFVLALHLGV